MAVRIVRLGSPRVKGEGTRVGTVRRPPRGVPKAEFATRDFYDVWLPDLAPSDALLKQGLAADDDRAWAGFVKKYRAEMKRPEAARLLTLLAALSHSSNFSVGCYCEDEARCHRRGRFCLLPSAFCLPPTSTIRCIASRADVASADTQICVPPARPRGRAANPLSSRLFTRLPPHPGSSAKAGTTLAH